MTTVATDAQALKRDAQSSPKKVNIRLELLSRDRGVQSRTQLDQKTIAEYAELMTDGAEFPALVVFDDKTKLWLADGFIRAEAALAAGLESFACDVRTGTRRDAVLHAIGANAAHGLTRTNADKRRAVETLIKDEEWSKWSDREIARHAGIGKALVHKTRGKMMPGTSCDVRFARRGDQVYEMRPYVASRPHAASAPLTEARGDAPAGAADWRLRLVRFSVRQFTLWQGVVNGRVDESIWAKAVDAVMRIT